MALKEIPRTLDIDSFRSAWKIIEQSSEPMGPEFFARAGMIDYARYQRHTTIPYIYLSPDAPVHLDAEPVICVSGTTATGKDGILNQIKIMQPGLISNVITTVDRLPRDDEKNGREYWYVTKEEFDTIVKRQGFKEWDTILKQKDGAPIQRAGTTIEALQLALTQAQIAVLRINYVGIIRMKELGISRIGIAIIPTVPFDVYKNHVQKQRPKDWEIRLERAKEEMFNFPNSGIQFLIENDLVSGVERPAQALIKLLMRFRGNT